jgi:hypothetical protein
VRNTATARTIGTPIESDPDFEARGVITVIVSPRAEASGTEQGPIERQSGDGYLAHSPR